MGYLVENDHAHIDFHKGTHGYPITNADDMMKPCPLMPDGEWKHIDFHLSYNPTEDAFYAWQTGDATATFAIKGSGFTQVCNSRENALKIESAGTATMNLYLYTYEQQTHKVFGEVRMSVHNYYTTQKAMPLQGSTAWVVNAGNSGQCYFITNLANPSNGSCLCGYYYQFGNPHNLTEEVEYMKISLYAYLYDM